MLDADIGVAEEPARPLDSQTHEPSTPTIRMSRYGIAEWYGRPFLDLCSDERQSLAATALQALQEIEPPDCPFRSITCNKQGGVCSIQPYEEEGGRIGQVGGEPVITCPNRFEHGQLLIRWLAEIVSFSSEEAMIAREVPFMRSTTTGTPAGKIDLVLASLRQGLRWFGLEVQAVYFSGQGMSEEFEALRHDAHETPPFPLHARRPDWRSSSAKRLMPQLRVKGPTLRRWHSKIAVAVDAPFFESLGGPSDPPSHDLDSGDVLWLVTSLSNGQLERHHWEVLTLEESGKKLLAAEPVTRAAFEQDLRGKLAPLGEP